MLRLLAGVLGTVMATGKSRVMIEEGHIAAAGVPQDERMHECGASSCSKRHYIFHGQ